MIKMIKIFKTAKLDFALLKYYFKSICFTLLVPVIFVFLYRSLTVGISFAMFMMSMSSIYTFSVAEKNDMQRFYGILPVSALELVCGKYLHLMLMGILTLFISGIVQPLVLTALGVSITFTGFIQSITAGLILFITYICFQLPGYYKFGPIKGRVFMYVPVIGILFTMVISEKTGIFTPVLLMAKNSNFFAIGMVIAYLIVVITVSIGISVRIVNQKK